MASEKYDQIISGLSKDVLKVMPDLFSALIILILGTLAAFLFKKVVFYFITRLSRTSNYRIAKIAKSKYMHTFAQIVSKLVFWSALFIAASMVLQVFGVRVMDEWIKRATEFVPRLLGAFLVVITGFLLARFVRDILRETTSLANLGIKRSIPTVIYYAICAVSLLIAVEQLGIEIRFLTSTLLVVLLCILAGGSLSFGIGSAPIVTNLLSTFYLRKRIKVGQHIVGQEFSGLVVEVGTTCVYLKTKEGIQSIPSKQLNDLSFTVKHARD